MSGMVEHSIAGLKAKRLLGWFVFFLSLWNTDCKFNFLKAKAGLFIFCLDQLLLQKKDKHFNIIGSISCLVLHYRLP